MTNNMRRILLATLLTACTDSYGTLNIVTAHGGLLGVGMTAAYTVDQLDCGGGLGGDCMTTTPNVTVDGGGTAVAVGTTGPGTFYVAGKEPGGADLIVTSEHGQTATVSITVLEIARTDLYVGGARGSADAFVGATFGVQQQNFGVGGELVPGELALEVQGPPGLLTENYNTFVGTQLGVATIAAPHGSIDIHIVDASAITAFEISPTVEGHTLYVSACCASDDEDRFWLDARSADGTPIVGVGPRPKIQIADPHIATARVEGDYLVISGRLPGSSTTLDVTWGSAHRVFDVAVTTL